MKHHHELPPARQRLCAGSTTGILLFAIALAPPLRAQTNEVGLDPTRSVLFENENLFFYVPQKGDLFGHALAVGDFDGDGADDLATGIPLDDGLLANEVADAGAVVVRYGILESGLDTGLATTFLTQQASGYPDPAEEGDKFGRTLAAGDFNGDGYDDLAIGAPGDSAPEKPHAGAVFIHYGSAGGIALLASHVLTAATVVEHYLYQNNQFGYALAVGNFDGDGYDDLAVGTPFGPFWYDHGYVSVFHGGASGLLPFQGYQFSQYSSGILGEGEWDDWFGYALAAGDFDGSGHDDLAVGVPREDGNGAVQVIWGSQFGLIFANNAIYRQFDLGETNEALDDFGAALATGDFDGDGRDDLAIGAPGEDIVRSRPTGDVTLVDAGLVTVLYGASGGGFDFFRTQHWYQGTVFPPFASESNDYFGFALAAGDFDGDGHDDLAMAAPGEFITGTFDGEVDVIMGSPSGLTMMRRRDLSDGLGGMVGDTDVHWERFGWALASGDFDGNGHDDLAVGAPYRYKGLLTDVGAEFVVYGFPSYLFYDGFESGDTSRWSSVSP